MSETVRLQISQSRLDFSFPWHVEEWTMVEGRWRQKLVSRHRSKGAAEAAMGKRQRQNDRLGGDDRQRFRDG